ncbi:MAG TPA: GTP-binding protein [Gammaproteobacteria bacterium]|jgi:sugar lactone lactonase YvrE|nr:GTP-binding protein [Gammaproteobacteria bacterium]
MFNRSLHLILVSSLLFINSANANSVTVELAWELDGLSNPESVIYDSQLNHLYVSNINGGPNDKDGNGFISIVSMDGRIINEKWMTGLNAPKGLAIYDRTLYIADIDELIAINIDNGRIINKYKVDDAKFLNDVTTTDNGDIYVSDMVLNRIHKLTGNDFQIWIESDELESPNGLHFTEDDIIVGAWGEMTDGFATEVAGHLKRISLKTKKISSIGDGSPVGNLDGVEGNDEIGFYVTDWLNGGLFHVSAKGIVTSLLELDQGSADIEYLHKKKLLFLPMMNDNKLFAYKVK